MLTKMAAVRLAQRDADRDNRTMAVCNLNPYGAQWVCREWRATWQNDVLAQIIEPAPRGLYVLVIDGRPAVGHTGKLPVWRDSQHVQCAVDAEIKSSPRKRNVGYRPVESVELVDLAPLGWRYVGP